MGAKQTTPCGAFADVKELEYISALHQTGKIGLRKDGSIHAVDIKMFLMSRYGIKTTEEEVGMRIMGAFGECARRGEENGLLRPERPSISSSVESDAESGHVNFDGNRSHVGNGSLDLTQVLALLLVPELLKAEKSLVRQQQEDQAEPDLESEFTEHRHSEKGGKYWPDTDLITSIQRVILHDATGDPNPRPLTKELIRQILTFYGEKSIAEDERLVDDMLMAANHESNPSAEENALGIVGDALVVFDCRAFARALTQDVQLYNIENENRMTSNYDDVFHPFDSTKGDVKNKNLTYCPRLTNPFKNVEIVTEKGRLVQKVFTFAPIDYMAETFRERGFVVILWATWISTYFAYLHNDKLIQSAQADCDVNNAGCTIVQHIVDWLVIMAKLSLFGTVFILSASLGNSVYSTNLLWIILGMGSVVLFVLMPYFLDIDSVVLSTTKSAETEKGILYILTLVGGFILLAISVLNVIQRVCSSKNQNSWYLFPGMVRLESKIKRAASYKVNRMVRNACDVHKTAEFDGRTGYGEGVATYGKAMLAFARCSDRRVESQEGLFQAWKKIYTGQIFEEDGIWFSTHLLAGILAQCILFLLVGAIFYTAYKNEIFQSLLAELDKFEKRRWRLMLPLFLGVACSELAVFLVTVKYIPSTVRTILQFRSGGIGSLHSKGFQKLRFAVDQSTLVVGMMFWGTLYTSVAIGFIAMVLVGLFLWPDFSEGALFIISLFAGIVITMLVKWIALVGYRVFNQSGYYRKSVALSNLVGVFLESWNLGLTPAYVVFRGFILFIACVMRIGRIDTPIISERAAYLGPIELDAYPRIFRKDILVHEAHRHPYLERLGVMYMLKLRHDEFGSFAGTCWRMLFVYALAPWMRKYRISDCAIELLDFTFASSRTWTGRMPAESSIKIESNSLMLSGDDKLTTQNDNLIADLTHQNKLLKKENDMMRSLLRQYQSVETDDHCPSSPGLLRSKSVPASTQSIRIDQDGEDKCSAEEVSSIRTMDTPIAL